MKTPKAPAAPDPVVTSQAQTASNKETALWNAGLNNVNQVTPYGNLTYTRQDMGPDQPPQYTSTITLNPESQAILDSQLASERALSELGNQQIGRISQAVSTPYSYEGLPEVFGEGDTVAARARAEEAIMSRMNPRFQQDEEALRTRLINQGIGQGSDAYQREMDTFNQARNDARMQAILSGQQYARAMLDESLTRRNQAMGEYDTIRNAPLNEFIGMTSGTQVRNPTFQSQNMGGIPNSNYTDLVNQQYQGQLNQYNQQVASRNSMMGGLMGAAGTIGGSFLGAPWAGSLFGAGAAR